MARGAGPNELQTSIRLSRELYNRLDSAREGRPLGEEIRRRLEASLAGAPPAATDPKTTSLLEYINTVAGVVSAHFGDWHSDPGAFAVFRLAINKILTDVCPEGDPVLNPTGQAKALMPDPTNIEGAAGMVAAVALWWLPGGKP
jgi:hypothetical protein